jgi:hypothetical protein
MCLLLSLLPFVMEDSYCYMNRVLIIFQVLDEIVFVSCFTFSCIIKE